MSILFKNSQGSFSIGSAYWKDANGVVTGIAEGYTKFGGEVNPFLASGMSLSDLPAGALVSINENGKPAPFILLTHNYEPNLNGGGRRILLRKKVTENVQFGSSYVYENSTLDTWLNGTYKSRLDAGVQNLLVDTKFKYTPSGTSAEVKTISRKVFALSAAEFGLTANNINSAEGTAIPVAKTNIAPFNDGGGAAYQWVRSLVFGSTNTTYSMVLSGTSGIHPIGCTGSYPARPVLALQAKAKVNPEPNADGSYTLIV